MQPLRHDASLAEVQEYVGEMEIERGLAGLGLDSQCLKLAEEVGELAAAVAAGGGHGVPGECVDVLILLASIANRTGIDLGRALGRRCPDAGAPGLGDLPGHAVATGLGELDLIHLSVRAAVETGELCRAVRKLNGDPSDPHGRVVVLTDRCAGLALVVGAFAHRLAFDLPGAFRAKESLNDSRTWV